MDEVLVVTVASEAARDGTALKVENRLDARFEVTYIACEVSKNFGLGSSSSVGELYNPVVFHTVVGHAGR